MKVVWQGTLPADLFRDDPIAAARHCFAALADVAATQGRTLPDDAVVTTTHVQPAWAVVTDKGRLDSATRSELRAGGRPTPDERPPFYFVRVEAEVPDAD